MSHSGGDSVAIGIIVSLSLSPTSINPLPPPFSLSLISRTVSVDVKHHVYLLTIFLPTKNSFIYTFPFRERNVPEDVPLVEFMYLVFTRLSGESYSRRLRSLLLYLWYVFRALINSPVCCFLSATKSRQTKTMCLNTSVSCVQRLCFLFLFHTTCIRNNTLTTEQMGHATRKNAYISTALNVFRVLQSQTMWKTSSTKEWFNT